MKNIYTMNVEFYTGVDERLEVPRILPPAPDFVDLHDARILIADDVADTGHTLRSVELFCEGKVGEVRTAVLYEKPHSVVQVRLRLEAHRPLDQLPVERQGPPVAKRDWAVARRLNRSTPAPASGPAPASQVEPGAVAELLAAGPAPTQLAVRATR